MKLAVTVWGNRISPVFDASRTLLVAELDGRRVVRQFHTGFDPTSLPGMMKVLDTLNVDMLVCGAILRQAADLIESRGILLIPFVTGNAGSFLDSYAGNRQIEKCHRMPGCGSRFWNAY